MRGRLMQSGLQALPPQRSILSCGKQTCGRQVRVPCREVLECGGPAPLSEWASLGGSKSTEVYVTGHGPHRPARSSIAEVSRGFSRRSPIARNWLIHRAVGSRGVMPSKWRGQCVLWRIRLNCIIFNLPTPKAVQDHRTPRPRGIARGLVKLTAPGGCGGKNRV